MNNNPFETALGFSNLSEEQLTEKLKVAQEKYEKILARASEFYDQELCDLFTSSAHRLGVNSQFQKMYITSLGSDYKEALKNYQKFENFQKTQLDPAQREISTITGDIRNVKSQEAEAEKNRRKLQAKEEFQVEKKELIDKLYEALDAIHAKIPKEAHDVGMSNEVALATYLPDLVVKVQMIEGYIERLERKDDVIDSYRLDNIKEEMEGWSDVFEK